MSIYQATFALIDAAQELHIDYLLVGSLAAGYYGLSRSTVDADFVVQLGPQKLSEVVRRMGAAYRLSPQSGFEIFTNKRIDEIQVVGTIFKIDVFPLTGDPFDQERFRRRREVGLQGRQVFLPTAEDVVVAKVRWSRVKDLEDAKDVLNMQAKTLDWLYVERWCDLHATRQSLEKLRSELLL